jgi:adenine-specific DNA glycosylase
VLAVQRPGGVVNAHLWELPNVELDLKDRNLEQAAVALLGVAPAAMRLAMVVRHSITRYRIRLEVYETEAAGARLTGAEWLSARQLRQAAFSSAHRKAVDGLTLDRS